MDLIVWVDSSAGAVVEGQRTDEQKPIAADERTQELRSHHRRVELGPHELGRLAQRERHLVGFFLQRVIGRPAAELRVRAHVSASSLPRTHRQGAGRTIETHPE